MVAEDWSSCIGLVDARQEQPQSISATIGTMPAPAQLITDIQRCGPMGTCQEAWNE